MEFLPWEIRIAFPGESQLRQGRATQPKPLWTDPGLTSGISLHYLIST